MLENFISDDGMSLMLKFQRGRKEWDEGTVLYFMEKVNALGLFKLHLLSI